MIETLLIFGVIGHLIYNSVDLAQAAESRQDWIVPLIRVASEMFLIIYLLIT